MRSLLIAGLILVACLTRAVPAQDATPPDRATVAGLMTLHLDSMHPRDVIAEITRKTGISIAIWPENLYEQNRGPGNPLPTSVTINADQQPFWSVMDDLCGSAGLRPQQMGQGNTITLQENRLGLFGARPKSMGPQATILVSSIQRNHSISFDSANPQVQRSCGISLGAYIDPRLHVMRYQSPPQVDTADDENGKSVLNASDQHPNWSDPNCTWQLPDLFAALDYDPQVSHKLAVLKGSIKVTIAAEIERMEIPDLQSAGGTDKTVAGRQLVISEVTAQDKSMQIKFALYRHDLSDEQWQQMSRSVFRAIQFQTAEGKAVGVGGGGGGGDKKLEYTVSANWSDDADKPVKLVWDIPTRTEDVDLPFEFHDLTLP
jgi:hypothetical protein